mgnify:CR=1 FL=1
MTGMRKRVTVGFLSIVCLLFFSGMVSFLELSRLSRDTGEILKANKRNIELAKEMLDAAHEQNIAFIRLSVFGDRSCDSLCRTSMERLENTLLVAQSEALEKSFLDSLAFATTELRLLTDNFLAFGGAGSAAARTAAPVDANCADSLGSRWYSDEYQVLYGRLTAAISKTSCICVFTNQIREKIGVMFGNPETTPGGRALKFFASVRIDIRRIGQIKDASGKVIGNRTKIKVVKNKVAPPFTECEFDIMYNEGISLTGSLIDLGIEQKILEKKGAWISYNGELIGQGREAAKAYLMEHPDVAEKIREAITASTTVVGGTALGENA